MSTDNHTLCTVEIQLTRGYTAVVDSQDADISSLSWWASNTQPRVYAFHSSGARKSQIKTSMHRMIYERMINRKLKSSEIVDHIDNNPLNNSRSNLRLATKSQNCRNQRRHKDNTSGYKGVTFDANRNKWQSRIYVNGKTKHLGRFDTAKEAYDVYVSAAIQYYGEFARFE